MKKFKKPTCRPRRSWEKNIKMDLKDLSVDDFDFVHIAQEGCCEGGYEVPNFKKSWEFLD
jgi:hypothetical protein